MTNALHLTVKVGEVVEVTAVDAYPSWFPLDAVNSNVAVALNVELHLERRSRSPVKPHSLGVSCDSAYYAVVAKHRLSFSGNEPTWMRELLRPLVDACGALPDHGEEFARAVLRYVAFGADRSFGAEREVFSPTPPSRVGMLNAIIRLAHTPWRRVRNVALVLQTNGVDPCLGIEIDGKPYDPATAPHLP